MDDYALAYLPIAPVEILIITFIPISFATGYGLWFLLSILFFALIIVYIIKKMGWWIK
jgi:ESS family glutamate:Na+ symporter